METKTVEDVKIVSNSGLRDKHLADNTDKYPMITMDLCPVPLKQLPDLMGGSDRYRRFGASFSLGILPNLDKQQGPIVINPDLPKFLVDADTLNMLEKRLHAEISIMFREFEEQLKEMNKNEGKVK